MMTSTHSMEVTVCGPNLRDQSKGTFHVHAAGCADLVRGANREPEYANGWTISAPSREYVAFEVYADMIEEGSEDSALDLVGDFHFFPCCDALPLQEAAQEPTPSEPTTGTDTPSAEELRADWLACCDALEFAQDQGHSAEHMTALEEAAVRAHAAMEAATTDTPSEPTPCPNCGTEPADADGFACDYCRGYALRPTFNQWAPTTGTPSEGSVFGYCIDQHAQRVPLTSKTRWLISAGVRSGQRSGDTGAIHGPAQAPTYPTTSAEEVASYSVAADGSTPYSRAAREAGREMNSDEQRADRALRIAEQRAREAATTDPVDAASHVLDEVAARLEILARAWRSEADYMRNGDRADLGTLPGRELRYVDAASRSLLRGLSAEVDAITRKVQNEIPAA